MDIDERIGRNVAQARGELSQKDLAERMRARGWKWSQATVWSIEKGERPLRVSEAQDLKSVLNLPFIDFAAQDAETMAVLWAKRVSEERNRLYQAVARFDEARLQLAVAVDSIPREERTNFVLAAAQSWVGMSAHDVASEYHRDQYEAHTVETAELGLAGVEVDDQDEWATVWGQSVSEEALDGERQAKG